MLDLQLEKTPPLATITLDRPAARNAYSDEMIASLVAALDDVEADPAVRAVILTGTGPAFSAGGDLKRMQERSGMFAGGPAELRGRYAAGIQAIPRRLARFDKPIIAAVNGAAVGAGLDLACMCDLRIAAADAKLGCTFVRLGLVPGDGGAYFLARTVGYPRALELALTGRLVDAAEALAIGLVHEVVPGEALVETARARALAIAALPSAAVRLTKAAVQRSWDLPLDAALDLAATYQAIAQNEPEHDEALRRPK